MKPLAYYNEIDPYAAQWLRNLISAELIAKGDVDERSIEDVAPADVAGYTQCHFFAGIGVWSYALRLAGWPDERPAWTGSCPCQPFSAAGKGEGFADERHLWPFWFHLISQCRPGVLFGEQVEAAIRHGWLDLVQSDLEGIGYACGAVGLPAAGFGAPHIRQRLWFVADADHQRRAGEHALLRPEEAGRFAGETSEIAGRGRAGGMADADGRNPGAERQQRGGERRQQPQDGGAVRLADANSSGRQSQPHTECTGVQLEITGTGATWEQFGNARSSVNAASASGPTNGHWRAADWLFCRDGKWRPVEPGTFPLAHGAASRVGRLRAYGNAIVAQVAAEVVKSYMECRP